MYVLIWDYVDVCINLKNLYMILKNTYIRFEKYDVKVVMAEGLEVEAERSKAMVSPSPF